MSTDDGQFKVVHSNGSDEVLASASDLLIGRAVFETAKLLFPRAQLEYRCGVHVLERSRG